MTFEKLLRKRITILFIISFILAIQATTCFPAVQFMQGDYNLAVAQARKENKALMIFIYTDWCGYCKMMDKNVFADSKFSDFSKNLVNVRINAEKGEGVLLARRFGVLSYPTIVFLDSWGKEMDRFSGYLPPSLFLKICKKIVSSNQEKNAQR